MEIATSTLNQILSAQHRPDDDATLVLSHASIVRREPEWNDWPSVITIRVEPSQYRIRFTRTPPPGQPHYELWRFDEQLEEISAILLEEGFGLPYRSTYKYKRPSGARYRAEGPFLYTTGSRKQPKGIWTPVAAGQIAKAVVTKATTPACATLEHAVEHYVARSPVESVTFEYTRLP